METLNAKMKEFYSSDLSLVDVETIDGNKHSSVELEDGKILVFEYIPVNDPSWCFYIEKIEDYYTSIRKVDWIMEEITEEEKETIENIIDDM